MQPLPGEISLIKHDCKIHQLVWNIPRNKHLARSALNYKCKEADHFVGKSISQWQNIQASMITLIPANQSSRQELPKASPQGVSRYNPPYYLRQEHPRRPQDHAHYRASICQSSS